MRWILAIICWLAAAPCFAQNESALHADFRREGERIRESCKQFSFKAVPGCAYTLFTDHPMHFAVGSIAPQNGFGLGLAFVSHYTPNNNWRLSWNLDGVASNSQSWRAGAYMKVIHTPPAHIVVVRNPAPAAGGQARKPRVEVRRYTVFNIYAQAISLNKLGFFGLGPDTTRANQSVFGMRQTIVGANVIKPFAGGLNLALVGEVNGRFVELRGNHDETSPSIERIFTEATAPGLARQPGFVQFGEGVRINPVLFRDYLRLNYVASFQQFVAPSDSRYSFMRWTVDLAHSFALYGTTPSSAPKDTNGPDECASAVGAEKCPPVAATRNFYGTIGVRLFISESVTSATSVVPFYFQPTLGGSDINGAPALSSYTDYRFRAPNVLLLRASFEHSIWGPFGFVFQADQGKVALTRGDIGFSHLSHSFASGLTLRAGGFPFVFIMYSWGGNEGNHTIFNMNTSLLGGSYRPSLY